MQSPRGSLLRSVRDREGPEELGGSGFRSHCVNLGQSSHLSESDLPPL